MRTPGTDTGRRILKREVEAIRLGKLWFGGFETLNDPMEGQFAKGLGLPYESAAVAVEKLNIGICSLSESDSSELMWAHYADEFHGICIAYDVDALVRGLDSDVVLSRVRYFHELPKLELADDPRRAARGVLGVKSVAWLYEREWRLLASRKGLLDVVRTGRPAARAVYVGFRMREDHRQWLESQLKPLGIRVCTVSVSGYGLVFEGGGRLPLGGTQIEAVS